MEIIGKEAGLPAFVSEHSKILYRCKLSNKAMKFMQFLPWFCNSAAAVAIEAANNSDHFVSYFLDGRTYIHRRFEKNKQKKKTKRKKSQSISSFGFIFQFRPNLVTLGTK